MSLTDLNITKKLGSKNTYTPTQIKHLQQCIKDPMYFMENFMQIQHPTKGSVTFTPYDYQREIVKTMHTHLYSVVLTGRQLGKTTCAAGYLLWYAMFIPDTIILIAANIQAQAMEIMGRIRYAYQELPDWLRDGVESYNKGSIGFGNGSRIVSRATTPTAGRGLSISVLYVDEMAFIQPNMASEFWTAMQPTLSTGGKCIVTSTPNSDEDEFAKIWRASQDKLDENGKPFPNGVGANGWGSCLVKWDQHPDRTETWMLQQKAALGPSRFMREHECAFVIEDETLIDPMVLQRLRAKSPEFMLGQVRWFRPVEPNRIYLCGLDPSLGTGSDPAAIQIFMLPEMEQVAEWKNDRMRVDEQVRTLLTCLRYIHNILKDHPDQVNDPEDSIYWSVENNTLGEAALYVIEDIGEEHFPGYFISEPKRSGNVKRFRKGLNTTNKSKLTAAAKMKSLVDTERMKLNSERLLSELKTFVASGGSYAAKQGCHDDLVMATFICVRLLQVVQAWDGEFSEKLKETIGEAESEVEPMPFLM
jgi:hypothetical protein